MTGCFPLWDRHEIHTAVSRMLEYEFVTSGHCLSCNILKNLFTAEPWMICAGTMPSLPREAWLWTYLSKNKMCLIHGYMSSENGTLCRLWKKPPLIARAGLLLYLSKCKMLFMISALSTERSIHACSHWRAKSIWKSSCFLMASLMVCWCLEGWDNLISREVTIVRLTERWMLKWRWRSCSHSLCYLFPAWQVVSCCPFTLTRSFRTYFTTLLLIRLLFILAPALLPFHPQPLKTFLRRGSLFKTSITHNCCWSRLSTKWA